MMAEDDLGILGEKNPEASHEAKLRELLHYITSIEVKLCEDATKEFIKLLKSRNGGELLHLYVKTSSKFTELLDAWKLRRGKSGISHVFKLISALLSHPDGRCRQFGSFDTSKTPVHRVLDNLSRLLVDEKLEDIYMELDSKEAKRQNAALQLMASIVRRGSDLASEVAKKFNFKLPGFRRVADYKKKQFENKRKQSSRKFVVGFAFAFLEVGKPGLLRWILQQKDMYSSVLRGLGNDDDETIIYVLSTLCDKILTEDSLVPPGLRSVLFGSATLEQLIGISSRENGGLAAELAHSVLLMVCTNPSNGLMPDLKRSVNPLRGNVQRLVGLMKKLRAADIKNHRDLLLAIVHGRPLFGSAYMAEFPYNLEDHASPIWSSVASLAADVISSVGAYSPFVFLDSASCDPPSFDDVDVQNVIKSICPRSFSRSGMNKGLLHSDFLVKNGTLRLLLEALKFLDSFVGALKCSSSASNEDLQTWRSLEQEVRNEVRTLLPDPQVLLTLLSPLNSDSGKSGLDAKRKAHSEDSTIHSNHVQKKMRKHDGQDEGDMVVSGISLSPDVALPGKSGNKSDELGDQNSFEFLFAAIWGLDQSLVPISTMREAEIYFYSRLVEALRIYLHLMPTVLEGSFEFFVSLLRDALKLPSNLLSSLLTLLDEYIRRCPRSGVPHSIPILMYKHLEIFAHLLVFSPTTSIRDQAYHLSVAAMLSTGAFDRNPHEVNAWFLFIPGFYRNKCSLVLQETAILQSPSQAVISFLCDAISTVGNNLFKYWDIVRRIIEDSDDLRHVPDVSPAFSPLAICILQKCLRVLNSESSAFSLLEKTVLSLYVCSTLKYVLQIQVDMRSLSSVIVSLLSGTIDNCLDVDNYSGDFSCEWRPLRSLLLFARSLLLSQTYSFMSHGKVSPAADQLNTTPRRCQTDEIHGLAKNFTSSIACMSPILILKHFPSVVGVIKDDNGVSLSVLGSIFFLEQNLLASAYELWPELFSSALKMLVLDAGAEGRKDSAGEINGLPFLTEVSFNGGTGISESSSGAFSSLLGKTPFHVLFPAIICFHDLPLPFFSQMQNLLLLKVSEVTLECLLSCLSLVLFWINQLQLSAENIPLVQLRKTFEICISMLNRILSQLVISEQSISHEKTGPVTSYYVHEAARCIFSHPAVVASLKCPLGLSKELSWENVLENLDVVRDLSERIFFMVDSSTTGLLEKVSDYFLCLINDHLHLTNVETGAAKQLVKSFNLLVERLLTGFKDTLDLCVQTTNFMPLLPTYHALTIMIRLISPFRLFKLAQFVIGLINTNKMTISESCRKSVLYVGCHVAASAFESVATYLQQPNKKREQYGLLWGTGDQDFDGNVIQEIYMEVFKLASLYEANIVDTCFLKAINAAGRPKFVQHLHIHPLSFVLLRIIVSTPVQMISYCFNRMSMTKAKVLFSLTELSSVHLSIFGRILSGITTTEHNLMHKNHQSGLLNEDFLMLLPTALSFMNSTFVRYGKQSSWNFRNIPLFYSKILVKGFRQWKDFVSQPVFQEEQDEFTPSSTKELLNFAKDSFLGKAVQMLHYHYVLATDSSKLKKQMKLFDSVLPDSACHHELLDCDLSDLNSQSIKESLNLINRILAKISLCRILLFPRDDHIPSSPHDGSDYANNLSQEMNYGLNSLRMRFLCALVSTWQQVVKRCEKEKRAESVSLHIYLEEIILRNIYELTIEMQVHLVQFKSIPFIRQLIRTCLLYRFEDPTTLALVRGILTLLCKGQFSCVPYMQLLLAHSQFPSLLHSISKSSECSQLGAFFRPMSSILRSFIVPRSHQFSIISDNDPETNKERVRQLEVLRLLGTLIHFIGDGSEIGPRKDDSINFQQLYSLLLSSYGATLSESDLELYNLMREINFKSGSGSVKLTETNYLWGSSSMKVMGDLDLEQNLSTDADEYRRTQFRENLPVDPKLCASTVLDFPCDRTMDAEPSFVENVPINDSKYRIVPLADQRKQRYDPVFILQFSHHILPLGFIEPVEFAGLGLLAVAFSSLSSPDEGMRKLGFQTLARYKIALEKCRKKKDVIHLCLLLNYVQNGIEEPWQRIPSVIAIFAAEASLILLDPSHDHYSTLSKLLTCSARMNMKSVPLFHDFLWSRSVNHKAERVWILRLVYVGLNVDDDAPIFIRNSIFENLLSFYASPVSDSGSKELILQIVKKSIKLCKMARYLVEHCGLFSWLSSTFPSICERLVGDKKGFYMEQLVVLLEVISAVISSQSIRGWLQNHALEQFTELCSHLFRFLLDNLKLIPENALVINLILQIIISSLKISQKRKIYQPHFTFDIDGLFHIYESVPLYSNIGTSASSEIGLRAILITTPPSILDMDREDLRSFVLWAISIAQEVDSRARGSHSLAIFAEEDACEDSLASKLLRWLTASVIHGKFSDISMHMDMKKSNVKTLESMLKLFKITYEGRVKNKTGEDLELASAILYLQQLLGFNCTVLSSVVSALCLLISDFCNDTASESDFLIGVAPVAPLLSRISCPPEAYSAWRWSFYQPWKDLSSERTDSEKMDEYHACQALLIAISNMLGRSSSSFSVLLPQDVERCGVYEWEISIIENKLCTDLNNE